jgi:phage FluMu protein Com
MNLLKCLIEAKKDGYIKIWCAECQDSTLIGDRIKFEEIHKSNYHYEYDKESETISSDVISYKLYKG